MSQNPMKPPGIPRWVKIFAIIVIVLVMLTIILHLSGLNLGGHIPQ